MVSLFVLAELFVEKILIIFFLSFFLRILDTAQLTLCTLSMYSYVFFFIIYAGTVFAPSRFLDKRFLVTNYNNPSALDKTTW